MNVALAVAVLLTVEPSTGADSATWLASARAAFNEGQFERALQLLETAAAGEKADAPLAQIYLLQGQCFGALRQPPRAREAFVRALTHDPLATLDPTRVDPAVTGLLEGVRSELRARLEVTAAVGAEVLLDDRLIGRAPLDAAVPIGRHRVAVTGSPAQEHVFWVGRRYTLSFGAVQVVSAEPRGSKALPRALASATTVGTLGAAIAAAILSYRFAEAQTQIGAATRDGAGRVTGVTQATAFWLADRQRREGPWAEALWSSAAGLAAVSVALWLWSALE